MRRWATLVLLSVLVSGCSSTTLPTPTARPAINTPGSPSATPSARPVATPSPTTTAPNPTASTPVPIAPVLRLTVYEGPSPRTIIEPPEFTLYADGRAIYAVKLRAPEELWPSVELQSAQLSSEQLNALVADALGPGGLRDARAVYDIPRVVDMEWNYFEVHAEGIDKVVRVYGLDYESAPDAAERAKFADLSGQLLNFQAEVDAGRAANLGTFEPTAYDAFIYSGGAADHLPVSADWPWADLEPSDFNTFPDGTLSHRLTGEQGKAVIDLGIDEYVIAEAPDGNKYTIRIQPLLPDEAAGPVLE